MPIGAFWMMIKNLPKLAAERDLRMLDCMIATQAGDPKRVKEFRANLVQEIEESMPGQTDDELDRTGLDELRRMM